MCWRLRCLPTVIRMKWASQGSPGSIIICRNRATAGGLGAFGRVLDVADALVGKLKKTDKISHFFSPFVKGLRERYSRFARVQKQVSAQWPCPAAINEVSVSREPRLRGHKQIASGHFGWLLH